MECLGSQASAKSTIREGRADVLPGGLFNRMPTFTLLSWEALRAEAIGIPQYTSEIPDYL